jgi:hypothetical protein
MISQRPVSRMTHSEPRGNVTDVREGVLYVQKSTVGTSGEQIHDVSSPVGGFIAGKPCDGG